MAGPLTPIGSINAFASGLWRNGRSSTTSLTNPEDHVFHIHTNDMLLTKINGAALAEPIWLDTAILPRNGSITFRSRFVDFAGKFMLHCHMMNHEDLGMMQVVEVYADD